MSITAGSTALAADFINKAAANATPSADAGRVVKLESTGKLDHFFLSRGFGGDASDGALSVSSGTTSIDCSGAQVVIKNYSSISITGTGKVAFTNPHASGTIVIFRSQGNVTITSSVAPCIDLVGLGSTGGNGVALTIGGGNGTAGSASSNSISRWGAGGGATSTGGTTGGAGGTTIALSTSYLQSSVSLYLAREYPDIFTGAGGGGGGSNANAGNTGTGTSGAGGRGGGGFILECGGALNFTTTGGISVSGATGSNATAIVPGATPRGGIAGGGGGGGGFAFVYYNTLTSASGTILSAGGAGGTGTHNDSGGAATGGGGGGGGGSASGAGSGGSSGTSGTSGTGGTGANGYSTIQKNTMLA